MEEEVELLEYQQKETPVQDFSLHFAARNGDANKLKELLKTKDPFVVDRKGRTPLHHAVCCGNQINALSCVEELLNCDKVSQKTNGIEVTKAFVDIQDINMETALHLAAKNESQKIVEKLIFAAADVNLKSLENKDPLGLIYSKVPAAMVSVLNIGITAKDGCEIMDESLQLCLDFGAIIGYYSEEEAAKRRYYAKELQLLSYALDDSPSSSREILTHPLVKLFLELKWRKIHYLFFVSMFFHITWLVLYTVFITEVYLLHCPYQPFKNDTDVTDDRADKQPLRFTWFGFSAKYENVSDINTCTMSASCIWMAYVLVGMSAIVAGKEFFEIASSRKFSWYFKGLENLGQWTLIISVGALCWPVLISHDVQDWVYEVAAFGVFLAWSLILTQIGKHPRLGLHVEILARVLKSFAMFMLIFASLLIAFALSLSLLLPGNRAFISLPLAFMKVVVMMTGELEYDTFFNGDDGDPAFPVSGRIIYLFFVIVVSITLFNLLIGFTVSDIQGLQQKAEVHKLSNQLEQIYLMESFILSRKMQTLFCNRRPYLKRFLVARQSDYMDGAVNTSSDDDFTVEISIKEVPEELRRTIRCLAAKNSLGEDPCTDDDDDVEELNVKTVKRIVKEVLRMRGLL
ncbi:unnamed protein product [Allacma fusca]|uniref:Ion transport domain-containing protein n=1 Tax=Allacma fusca TaxID=39272 RepID=A0A8J2JVI3_9HEXA|nr:unnamed protein product [Allacma fusca]